MNKGLCNKIYYEKLAKKFRERPVKVEEKWKSKLGLQNENFNEYFIEYYKIVHHEMKDTSLRSFQYKIYYIEYYQRITLLKERLRSSSPCGEGFPIPNIDIGYGRY